MARIIVLPDMEIGERTPVFDERVSAVHVDNQHSAAQLIERLTWAIHDAEAIEHEHPAELGTGSPSARREVDRAA